MPHGINNHLFLLDLDGVSYGNHYSSFPSWSIDQEQLGEIPEINFRSSSRVEVHSLYEDYVPLLRRHFFRKGILPEERVWAFDIY